MTGEARSGGSARSGPRRSAVAALAPLLVVGVVATACSSGAFRGPAAQSADVSTQVSTGSGSSATGATGGSASTTDRYRAPPVTYGYSLPEGDTSRADESGPLYEALYAGRCTDAQQILDWAWAWDFGVSPVDVLMYQVAIDMCAGNEASAATMFDRGEAAYGWSGVHDPSNLCRIYRAYLSFREQRPQDSVRCPGGAFVHWPGWPAQQPRDDPRTVAVESASPYKKDWPDVPGGPTPAPRDMQTTPAPVEPPTTSPPSPPGTPGGSPTGPTGTRTP